MEMHYEDDPFALEEEYPAWQVTGDGHELAFDDQPLEEILYGGRKTGPTSANLYLPVNRRLEGIREAWDAGRTGEALQELSALGCARFPLSLKACGMLLQMMRGVMPDHPKAILDYDLSAHGDLLERIWELALAREDPAMEECAGLVFSRWCEEHRKHSQARKVIQRLMEIYLEKGDLPSHAGMINNYGFEYLLEGNWSAALPFFEKAASIFEEEGVLHRYANARANYWTCRMELGELGDLHEVENELEVLAAELIFETAFWQRRKVLIVQAKIAELRGDVKGAIALVNQAIEATRDKGSAYTAIDDEYLQRLKMSVAGESDAASHIDAA